MRDFGTLSCKWNTLINTPPLLHLTHTLPHSSRKPAEKEAERTKEPEGKKDIKPSKLTWTKLTWSHRDWGSTHRDCLGLYQVLCIYIMVSSLVFSLYSWVWISFLGGESILVSDSHIFSWSLFLLLVCLVQTIAFVLLYYIFVSRSFCPTNNSQIAGSCFLNYYQEAYINYKCLNGNSDLLLTSSYIWISP